MMLHWAAWKISKILQILQKTDKTTSYIAEHCQSININACSVDEVQVLHRDAATCLTANCT